MAVPLKFYKQAGTYQLLPETNNTNAGTVVTDPNELQTAVQFYQGVINNAGSRAESEGLAKRLADYQAGTSEFTINPQGNLATQGEVASQQQQQQALASGNGINFSTNPLAPLTVPKGTPTPQQSNAVFQAAQPTSQPQVATNRTTQTQTTQNQSQTYQVKPGSNLTRAAEEMGINLQQLLEVNPEYQANPNLVRAGATLRYPVQTTNQGQTQTTGANGAINNDKQAQQQQVQAQLDEKNSQMMALQKYGLDDTNKLTQDEQGNYVPNTENPSTLLDKYGLGTGQNVDIKNVITQLSDAFGMPDVKKEIQNLDDQYAEEIMDANDNPWYSEAQRSKRISLLEAKYETKKNALMERLKSSNEMVGRAIDLYQSERSLQQNLTLKAMDIRQRQIENDLDREFAERKFNEDVRQFGLEYALDKQAQAIKASGVGNEPPTSYQEWNLAGGLEGTGKTYGEFISSQKPLTVDQAKANQFAVAANDANRVLNSTKYKLGLVEFPYLPNVLKSGERQKFEQASRAFINAVLRRESGATITDDEFKNKYKELIPAAGDRQAVIDQKISARNAAVSSIRAAGTSTDGNLTDDEAYNLYLETIK